MPAQLAIIERDESGNAVATYGQPRSVAASKQLVPREARPLLQQLISIFLPAGFPVSVTEDYVGYQIYDSLQAFSSSIAGLLTSRAVLHGFGVGDANATATSALLLTILQDSVGRIATILFAYKFGPALEAECKQYRFLADIFNDSAMILDCMSPAFPRMIRVNLLCASGSLRALCGVAGGASKASLSVHFAKSGNVGELNAKDSSQETVISLLGMLAGSFVVSHITSSLATWVALISLLAIHLATNYKAVRCVAMHTLNRQRTNIVFSTFQEIGTILTPKQTSRRERILERSGVLRWADSSVLGHAAIGVSFATLLTSLAAADGHRPMELVEDENSIARLEEFASIFRMQKYLLWPAASSRASAPKILICLKSGATAHDQVKAWCHALMVAKELSRRSYCKEHDGYDERIGLVQATTSVMNETFADMARRMVEMGWDLDTACIETMTGVRLTVIDESESDDSDGVLLTAGTGSDDGVVETIVRTTDDTRPYEDKKVV